MIPVADLASTFEFFAAAERKLAPDLCSLIAGGERRGFERITFRPRLMVDVTQLSLTAEVFGEKLFAPIIAGPVSELGRFHPEGELALVRGAAAAETLVIVSSRSSRSLSDVAAAASETTLWYQLYPDADVATASRKAVDAGCKAICLTVGVPQARLDWPGIERLVRAVKTPVVLKGVMDPEEARAAMGCGVAGIVVSNHGASGAFADPVEVLPSVVDAVGGKAPVFVDGGFRRGTDVLKALALGARAVLVGRPCIWGLAAYGSEGVERVLRMLQTEVARNMAMCGRPDLNSIDRTLIRIHRR
jgi:isopentenyl diphosphate isomerase/L-lactate dehydrogenase-like FMN-dependent dehydrogenase